MIYFHVIIFFSELIACCSNERPKKVSIEKKQKKIDNALQPDSIYKVNSITVGLVNANELQKTESRKQFMLGLDLLLNKNKVEASVELA